LADKYIVLSAMPVEEYHVLERLIDRWAMMRATANLNIIRDRPGWAIDPEASERRETYFTRLVRVDPYPDPQETPSIIQNADKAYLRLIVWVVPIEELLSRGL
jgi:hypothetical protein